MGQKIDIGLHRYYRGESEYYEVKIFYYKISSFPFSVEQRYSVDYFENNRLLMDTLETIKNNLDEINDKLGDIEKPEILTLLDKFDLIPYLDALSEISCIRGAKVTKVNEIDVKRDMIFSSEK